MIDERPATRTLGKPAGESQPRPWYREPWPWVLIAIPAIAVIASFTTLYLALANPDYVVLDVERYEEIRAELRAQGSSADQFTDHEPGSDRPADDEPGAGEPADGKTDPAPADSHGDR